MVKTEYANAGQAVKILSPTGSINAMLWELPFVKDQKK